MAYGFIIGNRRCIGCKAGVPAALRILSRAAPRVPFWAAVLLGNGLPSALLWQGGAWAAVLIVVFASITDRVWVRAPQRVALR